MAGLSLVLLLYSASETQKPLPCDESRVRALTPKRLSRGKRNELSKALNLLPIPAKDAHPQPIRGSDMWVELTRLEQSEGQSEGHDAQVRNGMQMRMGARGARTGAAQRPTLKVVLRPVQC